MRLHPKQVLLHGGGLLVLLWLGYSVFLRGKQTSAAINISQQTELLSKDSIDGLAGGGPNGPGGHTKMELPEDPNDDVDSSLQTRRRDREDSSKTSSSSASKAMDIDVSTVDNKSNDDLLGPISETTVSRSKFYVEPMNLDQRISKVKNWIPFFEFSSAAVPCAAQVPRTRTVHDVVLSQVHPSDQVLQTSERIPGNPALSQLEYSYAIRSFIQKVNNLPQNEQNGYSVVNIVRATGKRFYLGGRDATVKDTGNQVHRVLLDLEVTRKKTPMKRERFVVYVDWMTNPRRGGVSEICFPEGLNNISPSTDVYFVAAVKGMRPWVHHLIANIEELARVNADSHLHLVITDYAAAGEKPLPESLEERGFKNYHLIKQVGRFDRTEGIYEATAWIPDADSTQQRSDAIIFQVDLHMQLSHQLVEDIRQFTVPGKQLFAPIPLSLLNSATFLQPRGKWDRLSFNQLAIFKSDFVRIGGVETVDGTSLLNKALDSNMICERKFQPLLFHHHHSKAV